MHESPPDIKDLSDQLDAARQDSRALVADLTEDRGIWRSRPGSWSVAECLDHLAVTNRVYLHAMEEPAVCALKQGKLRRGPAAPGLVGSWFVKTMEPPVKAAFKMKTPRTVGPRAAVTLAGAYAELIFQDLFKKEQ